MENILFSYKDSKGVVSTRELSNWSDDGWLLKGTCSAANSYRTFRRDRILEVLTSPDPLVALAPPVPAVPATICPSPSLEILFTGFAKARRGELEAFAAEAGIKVRKTVSTKLDFICAGPNAGPSKLRKAQDQGVSVLDESDYFRLLETGEMPE